MNPTLLHAAIDTATLVSGAYIIHRYLPLAFLLIRELAQHRQVPTNAQWLNAGVGLTSTGFCLYRIYWLIWRLLPGEDCPLKTLMLNYGDWWGIALLPVVPGYYCKIRAVAGSRVARRQAVFACIAFLAVLLSGVL